MSLFKEFRMGGKMTGVYLSTDDISLIFRALNHAIIAHRGRVQDKTDIPYVSHAITTARLVAEETEYPVTPEMISAAFLHDILEKTDETVNSFPAEIRNLVNLMTDPDRESNFNTVSIDRIANNPDAIIIMMADCIATLSEENPFCSIHLRRDDQKESTLLLLDIAKQAGLEATGLYKRLMAFGRV